MVATGLHVSAAFASSTQESIIQDDAVIKADPAGALATYVPTRPWASN